ncbi:hypothetical protein V2J09_002018 [Rumex salicifolius]
MDRRARKKARATSSSHIEEPEVSSIEWKLRDVTDQEQDLIIRMFKLVGDRWNLIAGRIPDRKPEEIERFWIMKQLMQEDVSIPKARTLKTFPGVIN